MGSPYRSTTCLLAALTLCIAAAPSSGTSPTRQEAPSTAPSEDGWRRRALVVGVSDYPKKDGWTQLPGAVRDARRIAELLKGHFGFAENDVKLLLNETASREAILKAFREHLIETADENTIAVFFFAGHGSQMYDDGDDEMEDELDETIVPFDSVNEGETRRDIRDDELNALFGELTDRTRYVVGLFDCCHSGTVTRGGSLDVDLDVISRRAPRYVPAGVEVKAIRDSQGRPLDTRQMKHEPLILTACLDSQLALESRTEQRGLFTLSLERALRGVDPNTSWADVYRRVRAELRGRVRNQQTPVIAGPDQSLVFAGSFERPTSFPTTGFERRRQEDGSWRWFVSVDAGYLHGFTEGSRLQLVPEDAPEGARYEAVVLSAQVAECFTELMVRRSPSGLALAPPPRSHLRALDEGKYGASLIEGPGRNLALRLVLDESLGEHRERMIRFVHDSPYFALAEDEFDLHVGHGPDGFEAVDRFGSRILPHPIRLQPDQPVTARNDPELLEDDLRAFARWDAVRSLQNYEGLLAQKVDVTLTPGWFLTALDDSTFIEVPGLWKTGTYGEPMIRMDLEDERRKSNPDGQTALEITLLNEHDKPVHFVMFDVLPNWFVHKIDAITGVLEPGEEVEIRLGVTQEDDTVEGGAPEMLKFFFTEQAEDFRYVNSTGIRQKRDLRDPMLAAAAATRGGSARGRLSELLGTAMSGMRGSAPTPGSVVHWTSREVQFTVVPRSR